MKYPKLKTQLFLFLILSTTLVLFTDCQLNPGNTVELTNTPEYAKTKTPPYEVVKTSLEAAHYKIYNRQGMEHAQKNEIIRLIKKQYAPHFPQRDHYTEDPLAAMKKAAETWLKDYPHEYHAYIAHIHANY